jgi:hypothetical protein
MSGALPWSTSASSTPPNDLSATLERIEQNTKNLLHWVRILVVVVVVLDLVIIFVG